MLPIGEISPATLFFLGVLVIAVVLLRLFTRQLRQNRRAALPPENLKIHARSREDLNTPPAVARWEVQMHETARDLMGQLDSKIAILNQLIGNAEQLAERLENACLRASNLPLGTPDDALGDDHPQTRHVDPSEAGTSARSKTPTIS